MTNHFLVKGYSYRMELDEKRPCPPFGDFSKAQFPFSAYRLLTSIGAIMPLSSCSRMWQ